MLTITTVTANAAPPENSSERRYGLRIAAGIDANNVARFYRIGADVPSEFWQFQYRNWHFNGYYETQLGYYAAHKKAFQGGDRDTFAFRFAVATKISRPNWGPFYLPVGSGPVWLSSRTSFKGRSGGQLQFGTHYGLGWRTKQFELELRMEHVSNGSYTSPNKGVNIALGTLRIPIK